mmetsp:Transcript_29661/g.84847  ORF Transcript_29661/g.84847 Transcript_29661/m.84847 type:complete len:239 (+) Transcript_29661:2032-2748(+)
MTVGRGSCGLGSAMGTMGSPSPPLVSGSCTPEVFHACRFAMHSASGIFAPERPQVRPPTLPTVRAPERLAGNRLDTSRREPGIARPRAEEAERLTVFVPNALVGEAAIGLPDSFTLGIPSITPLPTVPVATGRRPPCAETFVSPTACRADASLKLPSPVRPLLGNCVVMGDCKAPEAAWPPTAWELGVVMLAIPAQDIAGAVRAQAGIPGTRRGPWARGLGCSGHAATITPGTGPAGT